MDASACGTFRLPRVESFRDPRGRSVTLHVGCRVLWTAGRPARPGCRAGRRRRASGGVHRRRCLDGVRDPGFQESHRPMGAIRPRRFLLPELHALRKRRAAGTGRSAARSTPPFARRSPIRRTGRSSIWTGWGSSTASSRRTWTTSTNAPGSIPPGSSSSHGNATRVRCLACDSRYARDEIQERLVAGEVAGLPRRAEGS